MMRKIATALGLAAALLAAPQGARAQSETKIGIGFGIGFLPMFIVDDMKLIEKHAKAAGIETKATYQRFSGSAAMQDAVLSGSVDVGVYGVAAMLIAWDKARNSPQQIFGIAGVNSSPLVLVSNKLDAKSIEDLGAADKIAMPALVSPQMYALQMIAEKRFGKGNQDKMKPQVVALPHPESLNAMLTGGTEVKAYFATPPFTQLVLDSGKAKVLTSSEEAFGGRSTFLAAGATKKWIDANPKMAGVLIKALEEANDIIRKDPAKAAAIYLKVEPSKLLDEAKVTAMLKAMPDDFGTALHGVQTLADFMGRTGGLKNIPAKWQDVVVPDLANTASN
jgi:NitT/TauT family transport system substrate-binding protein